VPKHHTVKMYRGMQIKFHDSYGRFKM